MARVRAEAEFQPLPVGKSLSTPLNCSLTKLRSLTKSAEPSTVFSYVARTVHLDERGRMRQAGSGPNFAGGMITLSTCKHRMRSARTAEQWVGQWVAGFSSTALLDGRQYLVFLTRIGRAYEAHSDLWHDLPEAVREAKSARQSIHGDLFPPRARLKDESRFDPARYHPPIVGHRHERESRWHNDIAYENHGSRAPLLLGDTNSSFVWTKPTLAYKGQLTQGYKKWRSVAELLDQLGVVK